jgi:hypothetical protein
MITEAATRPRHGRAMAAGMTALVVLLAGCANSAGTAPTPGASASATAPAGSAPTGCVAAPAPPANQEGWTTAPQAPSVFPVLVNSSGSLSCGENRLLFTFLDAANEPIGSPDRTASVALYNLGRDGNTPVQTAEGTFVWGIEGERGFYVATATFPDAGRWGAEFTTQLKDAAPETIRMTFDVSTDSRVVRVGEEAPASDTPTAEDVDDDLAQLSTDPDPDPALYETSVKDALAAGKPFVLIFATPAFCATAQCGPTLDRVKPLVADFPDVTFIHAEPYELAFEDGRLQPVLGENNQLVVTEAVTEWGLLSEPWVFVVDGEGRVSASFEGVVGDEELRTAIQAVE